jgi:phosphoglycerol transferase MdoB-like AlkP superfamily enzyme
MYRRGRWTYFYEEIDEMVRQVFAAFGRFFFVFLRSCCLLSFNFVYFGGFAFIHKLDAAVEMLTIATLYAFVCVYMCIDIYAGRPR